MFRILQHFLFTAVFAVFTSQASAMFIQADWFDPSDPAVGTNRYAYSHNDPINLADPGGNVPYNPGGDTSTGWTEHENGSETYDSRTDRYSSDYLNSDGDNHHTIGEYNPDFFSEDTNGSRTRTRSNVNSGFYDRDSGYRGAQQDAVRLDGSQNAEYARNTAGVAIGVASLATGPGAVRGAYVLGGRAAYRASVGSLKAQVAAMRAMGYSKKEIAIAVHKSRRNIGQAFKGMTPKVLRETISARNTQKYGDPLGPGIDYLRGRGKSWDSIIESATRTGGKDLGF